MIRRPPRSTRTDTLFPYTTLFRSNHGVLTVTGVITKSSNVGAAKIANMVPDRQFYDFVHRFGYGSAPGSGFPGESAGVLPPRSEEHTSELQSLMRISYAVFCLKKKKKPEKQT